MTATKTDIATLSNEQIKSYRQNGFLLLNNVLTEKEVDSFVNYETENSHKAINRGLQNHKNEPQWAKLANHTLIIKIIKELSGPKPQIVQTMYMDKPQGGAGVAVHQDTHYIRNEPNTLMACWIALSDTDGNNGGLCVVPGSNNGPLRPFKRVSNTKEHTSWEKIYAMSDRNGKTWNETMHSFDITELNENEIQKLVVSKGSVVFFTGMTIHGSFGNWSENRPRRAFATHYVQEGTWIYRRDIQEITPVNAQ